MERHQGHPQDHVAVDRIIGITRPAGVCGLPATVRHRGAARLPLAFRRAGVAALALLALGAVPDVRAECPPVESRPQARGDGSGRFYLGREIAHVMGHQGADWLERPEREAEERPDLALAGLDLKPSDVVADIGAGTGYYALRIARAVPRGRVLAVDVQPEMLARLRARLRETGVRNVEPVLGTLRDPGLAPASVDLVLMVDVYHEFSAPCDMLTAIVRALKPGGRVALLEYRAEDPAVPIRPSHKMSRAQAEREMAVAGLRLVKSVPGLPWQHLLVFEKR